MRIAREGKLKIPSLRTGSRDNAGQIKTVTFTHRSAKYNQLLRIEDDLRGAALPRRTARKPKCSRIIGSGVEQNGSLEFRPVSNTHNGPMGWSGCAAQLSRTVAAMSASVVVRSSVLYCTWQALGGSGSSVGMDVRQLVLMPGSCGLSCFVLNAHERWQESMIGVHFSGQIERRSTNSTPPFTPRRRSARCC
jgi:hypothetical protein